MVCSCKASWHPCIVSGLVAQLGRLACSVPWWVGLGVCCFSEQEASLVSHDVANGIKSIPGMCGLSGMCSMQGMSWSLRCLTTWHVLR